MRNNTPAFVPVQLQPDSLDTQAPPPPASTILINLQRGDFHLSVSWPANQAQTCAYWLKEWQIP